MDAKRIAEIRWGGEFHAKVNPEFRCGVAPSDLIALCDLAERGLAMSQARMEIAAYHGATADDRRILDWLDGRTAEILSNPKHERRG